MRSIDSGLRTRVLGVTPLPWMTCPLGVTYREPAPALQRDDLLNSGPAEGVLAEKAGPIDFHQKGGGNFGGPRGAPIDQDRERPGVGAGGLRCGESLFGRVS